ncbi:MAG: phosphoenolpyruvate carboxylase [Rhodospirillales bacterium]|nr:phosphoenolpyruvate carboxylase [Rhodospirillales bacterium]
MMICGTSFQALLERELFGIVMTAHPTFSQSTEMLHNLAELAMERDSAGNKLNAKERARRLTAARTVEHRPPAQIDLAYEHRLSIEAITNIQRALRRVYDIVFDVAAEFYPKEWEQLRPKLLTIASWVGYDLDGRSDIKWSDTLFKRLRVQTAQLAQYLEVIEELRAQKPRGENGVDLAHLMELLESRLALAIKEADDEIEVFQNGDTDPKTWTEQVRRLAKRMHESRHLRLIESGQLLELIERALELSTRTAERRKLLILRAELTNHGLGMAHTHVRLNAVQIHNAVRKLIDMETEPDDPARKRSYLASVAKLLRDVKPIRINFASILAERTSAKRLFMIVAQMLKYIDATTPVRFLIAETESPLTLLSALYFAKLFGVEAKVDISPLFETTKAFERGLRVIDECLQNPDFAAYVRQRGRLCIQTGFSDAGRPSRPDRRRDLGGVAAPQARRRVARPRLRGRRAGGVRHPRRIDRPRRPPGELPGAAGVCRVARQPAQVPESRHPRQGGDQLPGRRRLRPLHHAADRLRLGHAHRPVCADAPGRRGSGRSDLFGRRGLHQGVLRQHPPVQRTGDERPELRGAARCVRRQLPLSQRLARAEAPARRSQPAHQPHAPDTAARHSAQRHPAAARLPRQHARRRRCGDRQGPRALPEGLQGLAAHAPPAGHGGVGAGMLGARRAQVVRRPVRSRPVAEPRLPGQRPAARLGAAPRGRAPGGRGRL